MKICKDCLFFKEVRLREPECLHAVNRRVDLVTGIAIETHSRCSKERSLIGNCREKGKNFKRKVYEVV